MPLGQQGRNIVGRKQSAEHVEECHNANDTRHPPEQMNEAIAQQCRRDDEATENYDAKAIVDSKQLTYSLPGQHAATCRKADVHQAYGYDRYQRAVNAELDAARNHLRQTELRALCRMQRHNRTADQLA